MRHSVTQWYQTFHFFIRQKLKEKWKCQNWKTQMWHFGWFSNTVIRGLDLKLMFCNLQWFSYKRISLGKCPIRFLILDYNFASVLLSFCQESARKLAKCLTIGFFSTRELCAERHEKRLVADLATTDAHIVWKSPKMSHFSIFVLSMTCLVTLFDR